MPNDTLLLVHTPRQRFVVPKSDVYTIQSVISAEVQAPQTQQIALGTLFHPADVSTQKRQHAMIVPLRRREIALLVDRIDMLTTRPQHYDLPALLCSRLQQPWSVAAWEIENQLVIQLDVRAIARSILVSSTRHGQPHL